MGCFNFGSKRKVPDHRTPDNSFSMMKPRSGQPATASGRSGGSATGGAQGTPLPSPGAAQASLTSPTSIERDHKFGGQPQPLPAPLLAAPSLGKLHRKSSSKAQPPKPEEQADKVPPAAGNGSSRVSNDAGTSASSQNGGGGAPFLGGFRMGGGGSNGGESGSKSKKGDKMSKLLSAPSKNHGGLVAFSLRELQIMTKDFADEGFLGEGGFGSVYKGNIAIGETGRRAPVAVKVLNIAGSQGETEWLTEVTFLGHLHHPNLVRLIGYCAEGEQRLLVYEYMSNGSLESALFGHSEGEPALPWNRRMKIALGAARGLAYLHEEAEHQVIYRDFKTSNVLLDRDYETKLSDFGLARSGPEGDASHVTTRVVGTMGYAAPEYVMTGHLTTKSDVWSFGVVLLELLTGRVAMDKTRPKEEHSLVEWAEPYLASPSKLYKIMDPELSGRYSVKGAQLAAALIQGCLNKKPKTRPKMSEVTQALLPIQDLHDMAGFTLSELKGGSARKLRTVSATRNKAPTTNNDPAPPAAESAGAGRQRA